MLYTIVNAYLDACETGRKDEASATYKAFLRLARKLDVEPVEYMMKVRKMRREIRAAKAHVRTLRAA